MIEENSCVAVYGNHHQAEGAVRQLLGKGFEAEKLSIVGKGYQREEHPIGFYNTGERMKFWGGQGAFWGGLWGLLLGAAFFWLPGLGPVVIAGPLVGVLVAALEGAAVVGGLSALGRRSTVSVSPGTASFAMKRPSSRITTCSSCTARRLRWNAPTISWPLAKLET